MTELAKRREDLLKVMEASSLDGLLINRADEFSQEYVADYAKRLQYITGFSGSAGMALVGNKNAVFTDGRYTIQVRKEVNTDIYAIKNLSLDDVAQFINDNYEKGSTIGLDGLTFSVNFIEQLRKKLKTVTLVIQDFNSVDKSHGITMQLPTNLAYGRNEAYEEFSFQQKIAQACSYLENNSLKSMFIFSPDSINWLLNIRGSDVDFTPVVLSWLWFDVNGKVKVFSSKAKMKDIANLRPEVEFCDFDDYKILLKELITLAKNSSHVIGLDYDKAPIYIRDILKDNKLNLKNIAEFGKYQKTIKSKKEIEYIKQAHVIDGVAMVKFLCYLEEHHASLSEKKAAAILHDIRRKNSNDFKDLSFPTIFAVGSHGAIVHYGDLSDDKLEDGKIILIDSGAQYVCGTTDITRTLVYGEVKDEIKDAYTRVLKGHIALAMAKIAEGTNPTYLDKKARMYLKEAGLDYAHGTGHGVGYFLPVHERPPVVSKDDIAGNKMSEGMVFSNEPGYYKEGEYGIRIENLVYCFKCNNCERLKFSNLTLCPIALNLIDIKMLNTKEKDYLNAYHNRVRKELIDHLNPKEQQWLKQNTQEI